jgi:CRP-like cAMP-binding protein
MIERHTRTQADLVDQLFNSSEKRLARALLLLARFGKEGKSEEVTPNVSQEILAEMVGTTRSPSELLYEPIPKAWFHRLQWRINR